YIKEGITVRRNNINGSLIVETERLEKERIIDALKRCNFNQSKAAKLLGITQRQIGYKIQKYAIKREGL
ncbi:MAG TPA: helix-turn-helix domain-containing protein, partial [Syntrophorhabdaceae bacterium]|nr:helix-turn-helix domain-containing protein [Syntrophorhabdaceae bacterium]